MASASPQCLLPLVLAFHYVLSAFYVTHALEKRALVSLFLPLVVLTITSQKTRTFLLIFLSFTSFVVVASPGPHGILKGTLLQYFSSSLALHNFSLLTVLSL